MTTEQGQDELLEIYKLHAGLADKVSQRREGANRLYVSLITGLVVVLVTLSRYSTGEIPLVIQAGLALFGIHVAVSWWASIRSYRLLNSHKFEVLNELEKELPYPFFTREWELRSKGRRKPLRLTDVEGGLPLLFVLYFILYLVYLFCG